MRAVNHFASIALAVLLTSGYAHASLTCRVIYPERPKGNPKSGYIFDGKTNHQVAFSSTNFSQVIELPSDTIAIVLSSTKITSEEEAPLELPSLRIPEDVSSFYILMTPREGKDAFQADIKLIDCSPGELKTGETVWVNLSTHRLSAELGDTELIVDPLSSTITEAPIQESGHFNAKFSYQAKGLGEFAPISEQRWWHDVKSRHLGIIFSNGGKLPSIYYIRDFRAEQP